MVGEGGSGSGEPLLKNAKLKALMMAKRLSDWWFKRDYSAL